METGMPEWIVEIQQSAVANKQFMPSDIAYMLATLLNGDDSRELQIDGREVRLWIKGEDVSKSTEDLANLKLMNRLGGKAHLREVSKFSRQAGSEIIQRQDKERMAKVTAKVVSGLKIKDTVKEFREELAAMPKHSSITVKEEGGYQYSKDVMDRIVMVMVLAFILVYMIMASQFESLLQPFIISFNIPLAWLTGICGLLVLGTPFDTMAQIGLVVLTGIVVNDGILIIDKINRYRRKGKALREALILAGQDKIRPVLMTSATTIGGLIPMSLPDPQAAINWVPMARLISVGLLCSTLFTLIVVPLIYLLFEDIRKFFNWLSVYLFYRTKAEVSEEN